MTVPVLCARDAERLLAGEPPVTSDALVYLGWPRWVEFLRAEYLEGFIAEGGAKVKLLIGSPGSGKSHQLALAAVAARASNYLVAQVNARLAERVFPLDRLYGEVMRSIDLREVVARLCGPIMREVGYEPEEVPAGVPFLEWAERERGVPRAPLERRLLEALGKVARDPSFDLAFGTAVSHLAAHHLGYRVLNEVEAEALWRWFLGAKVTLTELRPLRLYRRVDRHTARAAMRSLAALALRAGYRGLVICVDNLDALLERDPDTGRLRYTRGVRDEAYEAIRELIDDIDEARATLILFAGRRNALEDQKAGISSYEALRLRLVPEVRANHFNPYADVVDLDQARALDYLSAGDLEELAARAAALAPSVRGLAAGLPPPEVVVSPGELRQVVLDGITRW